MLKKTFLGVVAVAAVALTVPSMAQASTPVPDLPTGVDPAHIADELWYPVDAHATLSGQLTLSGALSLRCDVHASIDYNDDGTSAVTSFTTSNCFAPGCLTASFTATNLSWGDRLGFDTRSGINVFRDYINVSLDVTLGPPCPVTGTFTATGTLFPEVYVSGSTMTMHFYGGGGVATQTGTVSGPLGTATVAGTLSGPLTSDESDSFVLVNTGA